MNKILNNNKKHVPLMKFHYAVCTQNTHIMQNAFIIVTSYELAIETVFKNTTLSKKKVASQNEICILTHKI